jgi:hypothetical protein
MKANLLGVFGAVKKNDAEFFVARPMVSPAAITGVFRRSVSNPINETF